MKYIRYIVLLVVIFSLNCQVSAKVKINATPFAQLELPDGKVTYKITQGADKIVPRDIKRVDVYVNNAYIRTLNLLAQTIVYKEVLVAADVINREQSITRESTMVKKIDVSQRIDYVVFSPFSFVTIVLLAPFSFNVLYKML